jgi:hypothetical protein
VTNANLGRKVKNRFKVPVKMWNRWSNHARRVFNQVHLELRPSMQTMVMHPQAPVLHLEHWKTIRWNAAWLAANAANGDHRYTRVINVKPKKRKKRGN